MHNKKKWIYSIGRLLMMVTFFITPATVVIPVPAMAADSEVNTEPAQFGESAHLPLLLSNDCSGIRTEDNLFGVQHYADGVSYAPDIFNTFQDSQSSWLRIPIQWLRIEPTDRSPDRFRYDLADDIIAHSRDHCINLILTIEGTPEWATTGDARSPFRADATADFVEFVGALVERYDADGVGDGPKGLVVKYWEFYNEPDAGATAEGGGWGNDGARYADVLEAVYPVIKAADPEAKVVFGGIAYDAFADGQGSGVFIREFLDDVLVAGGGDFFDIMNFHYYPFNPHRRTWTQSDSSGLIEKAEAIWQVFEDHGVAQKPLMITEIGWHSNAFPDQPSNDTYQGRHVIQMFTQSAALGSISAIWWPLFDTPLYQYESGLATKEAVRKPSYDVYLDARDRIGNAEFIRTVVRATADNDLEVHEFREARTNKKMFIAWMNPIAPFNKDSVPTFNDNATQNFQTAGNTARVLTKEGNLKQIVQDAADGNNDDQITITVGTDPIYIVID